jgi:glucosamine--fructose-6-phosphate aminotransferase (isomerizing)
MAACRAPDGSFQNNVTIIGCGTSYHVALLAEYLIEHIARIPVEVTYASEYRYKELLHREGDVLVVISSSGETNDTLECLRSLKRSAAGAKVLTVAVVNNIDSSIGRESDVCIDTSAGVEVGIASTKVFSAMALSFVLTAIALGEKCGTLPKAEQDKLLGNLRELPDLVQMVLDKEAPPLKPEEDDSSPAPERELWDIGCQNVLASNFIFLGRGFNFPIALEGAMKCKELAYIHAEGYPAAEMKHGPIALIDQFMPCLCIAPRSDPTYEKIKANIEEIKARSGSVIVITEDYNMELEEICEHVIKVPCTHEYLMPLVAVIPMQLLAYMMGILRGNEVDQPRGLSKSVVE